MRERRGERQVIAQVVEALNAATGTAYPTEWISPDRKNRSSKDVDAVIEGEGHPSLAIEHTEVQSVPSQKEQGARLLKALGSIESALAGKFPFVLEIIVPFDNVQLRQDWTQISTSLVRWLEANATQLPKGRSPHDVADVPFPVTLGKWPGPSAVYLMRFEPTDVDGGLLQEMQRSLGHKYEELARYRAQGAVSMLVLESQDVALVSPIHLHAAYVKAEQALPHPALDQIWCVTDMGAHCFRGPKKVMSRVNPDNFRFGVE